MAFIKFQNKKIKRSQRSDISYSKIYNAIDFCKNKDINNIIRVSKNLLGLPNPAQNITSSMLDKRDSKLTMILSTRKVKKLHC